MTPPAFCPHCGSDIRLDEPILLNDFAMFGDGYPLVYQGRAIGLSPKQSAICWTLLKAYPHIVRRDTLLIRIGSDAETNVIDVQLSRIRSKLAGLGAPNPIETVHAIGYRWSLTPVSILSYGGGRPKK